MLPWVNYVSSFSGNKIKLYLHHCRTTACYDKIIMVFFSFHPNTSWDKFSFVFLGVWVWLFFLVVVVGGGGILRGFFGDLLKDVNGDKVSSCSYKNRKTGRRYAV